MNKRNDSWDEQHVEKWISIICARAQHTLIENARIILDTSTETELIILIMSHSQKYSMA